MGQGYRRERGEAGAPRRPHPKDVGDVTVARVIAALVETGRRVLVPFGDNRRYDLAIDDDGRLVRVQCKTGLYRNGAVSFAVCSTDWYR